MRVVETKTGVRLMSDSEDLGNFGGGIEHDTENPEDEVNKKLTQWIASQKNTRVYWDREKSYAHGTFSISTQRRPDLFIETDGNNFVVEVKRGEQTGEVYEASGQAFLYWRDIVTGEAEYRVNNEHREVNGVLIATQHSPAGHLLSNAYGSDPRRPDRRRPRGDDAARGDRYPTNEHAGSQAYMRVMYYASAKLWAEENDTNPDTGIGMLLSSVLDGKGTGRLNADPAAFHIVPQSGKYSQNWDYIPYWKEDDHSSGTGGHN
jgi:hypothetical protein